MQRGRLARARRAADEEQAVGLLDRFLHVAQVLLRQPQLVQRDRLARGEDTHDDVLDPAGGRNRRDPQLDVERTELLELDLAVLGPPLLRDVQVAHDLQARHDRVAVARRHLDVRAERAVLAEADLGLRLARIGLDVDVRGALVVGVDDDLVDQLDQLVVGGGGSLVAARLRVERLVLHSGEKIVDVSRVDGFRAVELVDRFLELFLRSDLVDDARLREHVRGDARIAHPLRVEAQHQQALLGVVDRQPLVGFDVFPLEVPQQIRGLDPVRLERLVADAEVLRQRLPDGRQLDLELVGQDRFHVDRFLARLARRKVELPGGQHRVGDQVVVLGLDQLRLLALAERDRQRLRQLGDAVLGQRTEGNAGLVVDDLDDADQLVAALLEDRRHQHLLGAVAGPFVDLLQEAQVRIDGPELAFVVDVLDVDRILGQGDVARHRMLGDRELQVLERVQARLDLGDDRLPVLADDIDGQAVGVEQGADVRAHLQNDLVHIVRGVDLVGDRLQLFLKRKTRVDVRLRRSLLAEYSAHPEPPIKANPSPSTSNIQHQSP